MSLSKTLAECPFLPIGEGNKIVLVDQERTQKHGNDNDDDYYDEVTPNGDVVAKYHSWHHLNIYPPQHVRQGWAKFNLNGEQIASGKEAI